MTRLGYVPLLSGLEVKEKKKQGKKKNVKRSVDAPSTLSLEHQTAL